MSVIAKICCYLERSVITLTLPKEYLNTVRQYTSLTPDKKLNSLMYRTLFCVNIYGSYKLSKTVQFFGPPCIFTKEIAFLSKCHQENEYIKYFGVCFGQFMYSCYLYFVFVYIVFLCVSFFVATSTCNMLASI